MVPRGLGSRACRYSPVYAPALVAWVGGGGGFGISVGIGAGVGWFPLGPREVFVPAYHVSERYVTDVNVSNTVVNRTTVVNVYNNRVSNVTYVNRNATTVVSHDTFVNARPVARNVVSVQARDLAAAPVTRNVEATPERASVYGAGAHNAPHPSAQVMSRAVVAKQSTARPAESFCAAARAADAFRSPAAGQAQHGSQSGGPATGSCEYQCRARARNPAADVSPRRETSAASASANAKRTAGRPSQAKDLAKCAPASCPQEQRPRELALIHNAVGNRPAAWTARVASRRPRKAAAQPAECPVLQRAFPQAGKRHEQSHLSSR